MAEAITIPDTIRADLTIPAGFDVISGFGDGYILAGEGPERIIVYPESLRNERSDFHYQARPMFVQEI